MKVKIGEYIIDSNDKESILAICKSYGTCAFRYEYVDIDSKRIYANTIQEYDEDLDAYVECGEELVIRKSGGILVKNWFEAVPQYTKSLKGSHDNYEKTAYVAARRLYIYIQSDEKRIREAGAYMDCGCAINKPTPNDDSSDRVPVFTPEMAKREADAQEVYLKNYAKEAHIMRELLKRNGFRDLPASDAIDLFFDIFVHGGIAYLDMSLDALDKDIKEYDFTRQAICDWLREYDYVHGGDLAKAMKAEAKEALCSFWGA